MSRNIFFTIFLLFKYIKADIPLGIEIKNSRIYYMGYEAHGQNRDLLEIILLSTNIYLAVYFENLHKAHEEWITAEKKNKQVVLYASANDVDNNSANTIATAIDNGSTANTIATAIDNGSTANNTEHISNQLLILSKKDPELAKVFASRVVRWDARQTMKISKAIEDFCKILNIKFDDEIKETGKITIMLNKLLLNVIYGFEKPWPDILKKIFEESAKILFIDYWRTQTLSDSVTLLGKHGQRIVNITERLKEFIKASYEELTYNLPKENLKEQTIIRILKDEEYSKRFIAYMYGFFDIQLPDDYADIVNNRQQYLNWIGKVAYSLI